MKWGGQKRKKEYFNNQKETIAHKSDTINVIMADDKNCISNVFTLYYIDIHG